MKFQIQVSEIEKKKIANFTTNLKLLKIYLRIYISLYKSTSLHIFIKY